MERSIWLREHGQPFCPLLGAALVLSLASACDDGSSKAASSGTTQGGADASARVFNPAVDVPLDPPPAGAADGDPSSGSDDEGTGTWSGERGSEAEGPAVHGGKDELDAGVTWPPTSPSVDAAVMVADAGSDVFRPAHLDFQDEQLHKLTLPKGFQVDVFARNMGDARWLARHGNDLYLTRPKQGDVVRFVDADHDGVAESFVTVASELPGVHGIAFFDATVWLATPTRLYRATVDTNGDFWALTLVTNDLPVAGQHPHRTLGVGPDEKLYISVGSACNACASKNPEYAAILRANLDGSERTVFASGLRNTLGFGWHPTSKSLWGMDQGVDERGDDLPPEELNELRAGLHYGFPYCIAVRQPDPIMSDPAGSTKPEFCSTTEAPVLGLQAHSSPLGFVFYTGASFPADYKNDAFLALHGSWNRDPAVGYKVVRVHFDSHGRPVGFTDFLTGFLVADGRAQFGRPVGLVQASDGALLVSDDENGVIYRVSYAGSAPALKP